MAIKLYKPTTPGRRKTSVISSPLVSKSKIAKNLVTIRKKHSGRNNQGKITVRHKGGGEKDT